MEGQLVSSERSDQLSGKTRRIPTYEQVRWSHHTMTRFSQLEVIKSWILWGNPTFNHKANRPSVPAVSSQTTRRWFVQFHLIQRSILKLSSNVTRKRRLGHPKPTPWEHPPVPQLLEPLSPRFIPSYRIWPAHQPRPALPNSSTILHICLWSVRLFVCLFLLIFVFIVFIVHPSTVYSYLFVVLKLYRLSYLHLTWEHVPKRRRLLITCIHCNQQSLAIAERTKP